MSSEKLNFDFEIPLEKLEDIIRTKVNGDLQGYNCIVSLKDLIEVEEVSFLKNEVLENMIKKIPLRGMEIYPYENSHIKIFRTEPYGFHIGQNFALKSKLLDLMENLGSRGKLLKNFSTKGMSKLPPLKFFGTDKNERKVLAFYIPPFVEHHGQDATLIDGIHRSTICADGGTTINSIHIYNVSEPLPFDPIHWGECKLVDKKPPKEERYKNLRISYFRNLGSVGIDG